MNKRVYTQPFGQARLSKSGKNVHQKSPEKAFRGFSKFNFCPYRKEVVSCCALSFLQFELQDQVFDLFGFLRQLGG